MCEGETPTRLCSARTFAYRTLVHRWLLVTGDGGVSVIYVCEPVALLQGGDNLPHHVRIVPPLRRRGVINIVVQL